MSKKTLGKALLIVIVCVMFIAPLRRYVNNFFFKDQSQLEEEKMLGSLYSYNPRIEEIQRILVTSGLLDGTIDGKMGSETRTGIKEFQKKRGIKASGRVDFKTWAQLHTDQVRENYQLGVIQNYNLAVSPPEVPVSAPDVKLSRVKQAQAALKNAGVYNGKIDGKNGSGTKKAVRTFQKANGLKSDGVIGPRTWDKLSKYFSES